MYLIWCSVHAFFFFSFGAHVLKNVLLLGQRIFQAVFQRSSDRNKYSDIFDFFKECFLGKPTEK